MKKTLEQMNRLGFSKLTPIQEQSIKLFNSSKNIVGISPTGTGKTLAYLLPIIERLEVNKLEVQLVILLPTNELVIQVENMLLKLSTDFIVKSYCGGLNAKRELQWLEKKQPQIVIATPQKVLEFAITENKLKIYTANFVVLDEADMMFDEDFMNLLDPVIVTVSRAKLLLYSATLTQSMEPFITKYFGSHTLIDTSKTTKLDILQILLPLKSSNRLETLEKLISAINPFLCIVFVSKKDNLEEVFRVVQSVNKSVLKLDTNLPMRHRKKMLEEVFDLKYQFVVATDLASRGLDFQASHIINYDLPYHLEYFKHRSGRTGRMNSSGTVITLYDLKDSRKIDNLEKKGYEFIQYKIINNELVSAPKRAEKQLTKQEIQAIKSVRKPVRVSPNYRKKNKAKLEKALKEAKRSGRRKNR